MPTFELEFEVYCNKCGNGLCHVSETRSSYNKRTPQLYVDPCPRCLESVIEEECKKAYDEGYNDGQGDCADYEE